MYLRRASHLGFCFGVRDALALARREADRGPLTLLGELVHNPAVNAELRGRGVTVAARVEEAATAAVMITAHGVSDSARRRIAASGREVLEATCPLVRFAHRSLQKLVEAEGRFPVVIGQAGHVEVRGLTEDWPDFAVVLSEEEIDLLAPRARFGIVSQTTQPVERVQRLVAHFRQRFPESDTRFIDTVCQPTKQRQTAATELARGSDVVIVIGGANSNNTRELELTCRRDCARVHRVSSAEELRPEWIDGAERVGITAGTSTPDEVIDAVETRLAAWSAHEAAVAVG